MIDLSYLLENGEKITVEAKKAEGGLPNSMWESYSAFANSYGGTILLGVDEDNNGRLIVTGVKNPDKRIKDIWNLVNNSNKVNKNILFEEDVYELDYEGKSVIVVEVPRADRSDKPIFLENTPFGRTFRRNRDGDYKCKDDAVKSMIRDSAGESADSQILDKCPMEYMNKESIKAYRTAFQNIRPDHVWSNLGDEEFLSKVGAARKGDDGKVHPTVAGLLFFGDFTYITDFIPNFFLDYQEKKGGKKRWTNRICSGDGDWSGNIFDFYFRIIHRLTEDIETPFMLDKNSMRIDETPVHDAIREALANALIHADYYGRCGIVIEKDYNKIKFSNPGTFRIDINAAIDGGISDARNTKIFNLFALLQIGERSGMGLCDLYDIWQKNGFSKPEIEETLDPDRVVLQLNLDVNDDNREDNEDNREDNTSGQSVEISKNEQIILEAISSNTLISVRQIVSDTGIPKATTERAIKGLKEKGYISRKGSTRGKWIILK